MRTVDETQIVNRLAWDLRVPCETRDIRRESFVTVGTNETHLSTDKRVFYQCPV